MTDNGIIWTGDNVDEVLAYAKSHDFGFVLGSDYYNWRWYHRFVWRALNKTGLAAYTEWWPPEDPKVLEIYPDAEGPDGHWHWTTVRPGDRIYGDGSVEVP